MSIKFNNKLIITSLFQIKITFNLICSKLEFTKLRYIIKYKPNNILLLNYLREP